MRAIILCLLIFINIFPVYEEKFIGEGGINYSRHHLHVDDYEKGYVELLSQLTECGPVSFLTYRSFRFNLNPHHIVLVIEDCDRQKIIAAGTLLIEPKIIHSGAPVGHIEDIVTDCSVRGQGFGKNIVLRLVWHAKEAGCYKAILDCKVKNISFYEKCGFMVKGTEMEILF